ncbi:MAG: aldo/keto reductase [Clostridiales bacterium]|jgi:predicted aldo/keto reductase-like oxidoreductase|nr:aldo/keto reductase [Clostridiales bacterium]
MMTLDYLGKGIRKLGFGLMRLPMIDGDVDIEQTKQMVDLFMEKGFTYFDTAYGYIGGKSEEAAKTAIVDRYPRESFQLATKLPAWAGPKTAKEAQDMFWTSLKRTGAGYFDFYLLHNLGAHRTKAFDDYGIWDFALERKKEGLIKHLGFSMHAAADRLDEILAAHPEMEFVQLQINYSDWESSTVQSRKCYETARKYNKPVIIMEPVKGGALAKLPESASNILREANPGVSAASWAIRFGASLDGVITVLSGMSTIDQMRDNISFMENFQPLDEDERSVIEHVREALAGIPQIPCTDCKYCEKGCPKNVAIPGTFTVMNDYLIYRNLERAKGSYHWETLVRTKASECIACGRCEAVCPQNISIIDELGKASAVLES